MINYMQECKKRRKYWEGALYRNLFLGYYDTIYSTRGECSVKYQQQYPNGNVLLETRVFWWRANDLENRHLPKLRKWCISNISDSSGNCRKRTGDLGTMVIYGWRHLDGTPYKSNRHVLDLEEIMVCATEHFSTMFPNLVNGIARKSERIRNDKPLLKCSAVSELIVSKDLVNSCHIDCNDKEFSLTTWMEAIPGQTVGKYFILPYTSMDGTKSLVFPIVDGQSIAWDGRIIRHCSGEGIMGPNNSVYGMFFSSK